MAAVEHSVEIDVNVAVDESGGVINFVFRLGLSGDFQGVGIERAADNDVVLHYCAEVLLAARGEEECIQPVTELLPRAVGRKEQRYPLAAELGELVQKPGLAKRGFAGAEYCWEQLDQRGDVRRRKENGVDAVDDSVLGELWWWKLALGRSVMGERGTHDIEHGKPAVKVQRWPLMVQSDSDALVHSLSQLVVGESGDDSVVISQVLGTMCAIRDMI